MGQARKDPRERQVFKGRTVLVVIPTLSLTMPLLPAAPVGAIQVTIECTAMEDPAVLSSISVAATAAALFARRPPVWHSRVHRTGASLSLAADWVLAVWISDSSRSERSASPRLQAHKMAGMACRVEMARRVLQDWAPPRQTAQSLEDIG